VVIAAQAQPTATSQAARLVVWEESTCPLCGHGRAPVTLEAADPDPTLGGLRFAVVRCERCGLLFTNPRPDAATIANFYSPAFAPHRRARLLGGLARHWRPLARLLGRPCPERRRLPWHGAGRLLDFGCGGGAFLLRMQDQGWKATGIDRSEGVVRELRDKVGVKALVGTLPHPDLTPESFDVVTMWSSLAHVHRPLETLREAYQLLVPGGRFYVEVPNVEGWGARVFGPAWAGFDLPRHLTHFTPPTLHTMLTAAGFRVLSTRTVPHPDWMRRSARAAWRAGGTPLWPQLLRLKPFANLLAWAGYVSGRADGIMSLAERPA
jgi:SAM-dependent methyltransferase